MVKLRYGGFVAADYPEPKNTPWERLHLIHVHLEAGTRMPPYLAGWLGRAIFNSNCNTSAFLINLGLKERRGRPKTKNVDHWEMGRRVAELEDAGMKPEKALTTVLEEDAEKSLEPIERSTLQRCRNSYRKTMAEIDLEISNEENPR